jgi:DHA1 family tetracycline resistance protein-like MFS transporter
VSLASPARAAARQPLHLLLPLYIVVFMGFIGYSLMITVFTPMLLRSDRAMLPAGTLLSTRTILLGLLLCLYPLGQFIGSPILGTLSDRFGRRPILLVSLAATTACYVLISLAITVNSLALLAIASMIAGLAEANIVTAQSAIADVIPPEQRNRYFGYIYMAVSLAYIIGPLGGGKLTDPKLVSWFSDATPFWRWFSCSPSLCSRCCSASARRRSRAERHPPAKAWRASWRSSATVGCGASTA